MSRIPPLTPAEAPDEDTRRRLEESREGWYGDTAFFGAIAHQPALLARSMELFSAFPQSEELDTELLELMRLRVAASHRCAYCGTVRTRSVAEAVAPKERAVFERDYDALEEREALAVRLAEAMSVDPHGIDDLFFAELEAAFSAAELVELLTFAAVEVGFDRFCIALRLDTDGESAYPSVSYPLELD